MKAKLILISIVLLYMSCQKDVIFDGDTLDYDPAPFIESILSPGELPTVYLSTSLPFFNEKVAPQQIFARNAEVKIISNGIVDILEPDSTFDKFRCRWLPFYKGSEIVIYGQSYDLSVIYQGQEFTASTTIDQPKITIEDIQYIPEFFDVYGGHDGVTIRFQDAIGPGNFYRFQMDRMMDNSRNHAHVLEVIQSTCTEPGELFKTVDLGRTIFSDLANDGKMLQFNAEVSFEYLEGDEATIYIQSLDSQSAAFFQDLDQQLQSILNPFVEPTILQSTIDGTLGVFGSVVRSDPKLFVYPQDNP